MRKRNKKRINKPPLEETSPKGGGTRPREDDNWGSPGRGGLTELHYNLVENGGREKGFPGATMGKAVPKPTP